MPLPLKREISHRTSQSNPLWDEGVASAGAAHKAAVARVSGTGGGGGGPRGRVYLPRRADQGALAAPTEEPPPLAGWMWKKSGSRHGFKRRWFLLTDGRLRYYNKKPNAAAVAKASQRSAQQGYDYGCKGFLRLHEVRRVRAPQHTLFN